MNESDGTILGELDHEFKIYEDPASIPGELEFVSMTTRGLPPEERDVLTDTAVLIW